MAIDHWTAHRVPSIEYPALAASASIEGTVEIECALAADGSVGSTRIVSGEKILAAAAEQNARKWKFKRVGEVTAGRNTFLLVYRFRLEGISQDPVPSESVFEHPNLVVVRAKKPHWQP